MFINLMENKLKPKEVNDALNELVQKSPPSFDSSDEGKVLSVDDDGNLEWRKEEAGLPAVTSGDEGKVLTVNNEGEWTPILPAEPSSGLVKKITYQGTGTTPASITVEEPEFIVGIGSDSVYSILPISLKASNAILCVADSTPSLGAQCPIGYQNGKLIVGSGAYGWTADMCFNNGNKTYDLYYIPKQATNRKRGK